MEHVDWNRIKQTIKQDNELCEDEGCPQSHMPHVCVTKQAEEPKPWVNRPVIAEAVTRVIRQNERLAQESRRIRRIALMRSVVNFAIGIGLSGYAYYLYHTLEACKAGGVL